MTNTLLLITGGAIGTLLRYFITGWSYKMTGGLFPWGTIAVNMIGSFAIGFLWGFLNMDNLSPHVKNLVFIGILGSFTTFSAFSIETFNLFRFGEIKLAALNIIVGNIGGLILVAAGFGTGRFFHSFLK